MRLGTTFSQLEEMKVMAGGSPERIAKYSTAKREYEAAIAHLFNDESVAEFVQYPNLNYVNELEQKAAETGDPDDEARAIIMRDRYTHNENSNNKSKDWRASRKKLTELVNSGGPVTKGDLDEAHRLVRYNSSTEVRVLYATLKRKFEGNKTADE
ncbi:hypothetical protein J2Z32_002134 [Paenibacillus turicensis]|uniref:Uncharacterized protein n=1 Tax=Paenibacillus turicensis TaxID=160487 RepID=A0ABS4FSV6_9BACL|nr:hypothetical protein [Paenibacillus turicensis]MBP1905504.1 hypothetical protein [Paenibacillus turicensis]